MKNPFEKEDPTGLIVGLAAGVAAGILGYLFLTDKGAQHRRLISKKFKETLSNEVAAMIDKNDDSKKSRQRGNRCGH